MNFCISYKRDRQKYLKVKDSCPCSCSCSKRTVWEEGHIHILNDNKYLLTGPEVPHHLLFHYSPYTKKIDYEA